MTCVNRSGEKPVPYSPREALTVAIYNAGVDPLHHAYDIADEVLNGLKSMGYELFDVAATRDRCGSFVSKAALRALPDLPSV